ncbi:hypothetical protein PspTeo4_25440 [Pseudomonas sp. Teo4]|nr:hypothetical protein [Pseudomonas sp. Teo4]
MTDLSQQQDAPKSWDRPADADLASWMQTRIARYETRRYDWDALKFQADYDPKFRRAQMRYVGTGGTGVSSDMNTIPSEHFTFSTMVIPAGHEGPPHLHTDVEEVFFVLRGKLKVIIEKDGERFETVLTDRDLISVPPGVYREEINIGDEDALMCVMLGAKKPVTRPTRQRTRWPRSSAGKPMMPLTPTTTLLDQRFAERLLRLDGGQLAVRQAGSGEAVVLLHGIGSGAASWLQVAMGLSERAG